MNGIVPACGVMGHCAGLASRGFHTPGPPWSSWASMNGGRHA